MVECFRAPVKPGKVLAVAALLNWAVAPLARADTLDFIGVSQVRLLNPALTGTGITVAMPEGSTYLETPPGSGNFVNQMTFEFDPVIVQTTVPTTYVNINGASATSYPNAVGFHSDHADSVAILFFGHATFGDSAGVVPNIAAVLNYDADYFFNNIILNNVSTPAKVINQSFILTLTNASDGPIVEQLYDNYVVSRGSVIISSAGNGGVATPNIQVPATSYNVIAVGSSDGETSVGPVGGTAGGRAKPDISAPGAGTSYSAPLVSGVATMMVQAGSLNLGGAGTSASAMDPRTIKALLLNGAMKPALWTHTSTVPVDLRFGAGIVNANNSYLNLTAGKQSLTQNNTVPLNTAHPPISSGSPVAAAGWNLQMITTSSSADSVDHYLLDLTTGGSLFTLTSTLAWNRPAVSGVLTGSPVSSINNMDLFVYDAVSGGLVASSVSTVDNVEHLGSVVLSPGKYDLQVLKHGGSAGNPNWVNNTDQYSVAWNTATIDNSGSTVTSPNGYFEIDNSQTLPGIVTNAVQVNAGGTLNSGSLNVGSLNVKGIHHIVVNSGVSTIGSGLTIAGATGAWTGKLDLNNNSVLLRTTSQNTATTLSRITDQVKQGYGGGNWNGTGGITSGTAAAASTTSSMTGLGVATGAEYRTATGSSTFEFQTYQDSDILIKYTLSGDANMDGSVTFSDFLALQNNYDGPGTWQKGDWNYDGNVTFADFLMLQNNYNKVLGAGALRPSIALTGAAVPEPAALSLVGMGLVALLVRKPRRKFRLVALGC